MSLRKKKESDPGKPADQRYSERKRTMNMLSYILLGLLLICSLTVFGVFGAPSEMPVWYTCSVIILVATIGIFVYLYIKSQKQKKAVQALRGYVYYDKEKQILTVEKRLPEFERAITLTPVHDTYIKKNPEKLHYGSATVGGVTTGGFYKTGGNDYLSTGSNTGTYMFRYKANGSEGVVSRIALSDDLYKEAKNSSISGFLNADKQIVLVQRKSLSKVEVDMMMIRANAGTYQLNAMLDYPTQEKCRRVIDWLSGRN